MLLRPITIVGGKGGVGKTTVACALAVAAAARGERTLLLSTDPAHSLGDALRIRAGHRPVEVAARLWVCQPDPDLAVAERVAQVVEDASRAVPREIMPAVRRHLEQSAASPGMAESALADQLITAMAQVPERWDRLVVDSAPTGQLLRMVNLPSLLAPWVHGLVRQRERAVRADRFAEAVAGGPEPGAADDPLLRRLHERRRRLEAAAERLRGADAEVCLVLVPRGMVIAETRRARAELTEAGIPVGRCVVNQVPQGAGPDVLDEARAAAGEGAGEVPLLGEEPRGLAALGRFAELLTSGSGVAPAWPPAP